MTVPELPDPALTIRLFGPLEVCLNGRPLPRLRFRKSQWLLALLALRHGAAVEREWLLGLLWPESSSSQALRNCLTDLRHAFGDQAGRLRSPTPHTLCLERTGAQVDLVNFDAALARGDEAALEEAVALYRGPLLEGCSEEWVFQERQQREQAYLAARERLAALALERGAAGEAERHWRLAVAVDPLRESTQRALMQLLAAGGNYAGALLCYRELRLHLHRELNAEPDPETKTLFQQLRSAARRLSAQGPAGMARDSGTVSGSKIEAADRHFAATSDLPSGIRSSPILETRRHNLPVQRSPLIGREQDVARALQLLRRGEVGLLTLTGPGGSGKTRLGLQVAAELLSDFEHGAVFVGLAPIRDPHLVPIAIAQTLGVRELGGMPLVESLKAHLKEKQLLLLLDNFEQVLPAAPLVSELLAAAPRLKVLVTSRAALHLRGEKQFGVPPLALPDPKHIASPDALSRYPAVELFIHRALDVKADFALTNENALAVGTICHRLDGLPLAIELAAARLTVLTPQALLSRLGRRLPLLTGGARDLTARQQTLRDTIAWSYDLVDESGKRLFRRLAVFIGGCVLEAAEAVGNGEGAIDTLEILSSLVDNNLLQQEEDPAGEPRFSMLETIREFGLEQLTESGENDAIQQQHAAFFLALAEAAEPELGVDVSWVKRLDLEHDNLRAALEWCARSGGQAGRRSGVQDRHRTSPCPNLNAPPSEHPNTRTPEHPSPGEIGLRLAGALGDFWFMRGHLTEGRARLATALAGNWVPSSAGCAAAAVRAKALCAGAALALLDGDRDSAAALVEDSLALSRQDGDQAGTARALGTLAEITVGHTEIDDSLPREKLTRAVALAQESLVLYEEIGDRRAAAKALTALGVWTFDLGDQERGRALLAEALAQARAAGCRWQAGLLRLHLAHIEMRARHKEQGRALLEESVAIAREFGCRMVFVGEYFHGAVWMAATGDAPRLSPLLGECLEESLAFCQSQGTMERLIWPLLTIARVALARGDPERVRSLLDEGERVTRAIEDPRGRIDPLGGLGHIARDLGDYERAAVFYRESLPLRQEVGTALKVVQSLEDLGVLAARRGQTRRAARLLGASEAHAEPIGESVPVCRPAEYYPALSATKATLGDEAFAAAWAEGRAMSLEEAVCAALAQEEIPTPGAQGSEENLGATGPT